MTDPRGKASVRRVAEALEAAGVEAGIVALNDTARSAKEAAAALGCGVGQIVKSLVFRIPESGEAVLVLASGANQVDERKVGTILGAPVERPDARSVKAKTGFSIGGVPPVGHREGLRTLVDRDLLLHGVVWSAAGHTHAVFPLPPGELVRITGGEVGDLRCESAGAT
ncbi:hypothetical protein RradSPS_1888 [Rubrobacter radiotolerans]|uniref:YbaK/EbsC family protein n=1 Tax=Rubrobacter radiotolerans TaxID=42256 RepID=A0A023X4P2_RUBRA|nr:YbaK/EbsC family protein [Rubrobacter radiotolerans]AHY47171.1 hypothetical protein RradSPS_1888 [Rubrobacter radiotolerans]MDX5894576.1 YbaK/EbsC family protein [Rubrobacter radiotolerans]SMC06295.1 Cys-tRNA(Pro) deacylase, prolyl-tRNA editing enzyme YbaK/EbsC [Rubrobacter radiotolerans DSM 5868]